MSHLETALVFEQTVENEVDCDMISDCGRCLREEEMMQLPGIGESGLSLNSPDPSQIIGIDIFRASRRFCSSKSEV